uniref:Ig-like domain-containing protein n=1 Tax=Maylandia zebra TaxID=106582 RepID=A0A3P9CW93_9CICH
MIPCTHCSLCLGTQIAQLQSPTLHSTSCEFDVVGSLQPILAAPGDDVILPCRVEPKFNVAGLTVEWSRPDRRPDPNDRLSRVEYVHLYRDAREVPDMKIPSYVGRTALFTDSLREGNISLRITNVTQEDEGRYRCFIPKLKSQIQSSIVHLIVGDRRISLCPVIFLESTTTILFAKFNLWDQTLKA